MTEKTPEDGKPEKDELGSARAPSFSESLAAAAKQSGLSQLKPGETPSARAVLAAVGGILTVARIGTAQPSANTGAELLVITAVILGGASLNGGKGTLSGIFLGLFVLGALNNGLVLLSVPAYWQQIVQGAALLIAVLYDEFRNRGADE